MCNTHELCRVSDDTYLENRFLFFSPIIISKQCVRDSRVSDDYQSLNRKDVSAYRRAILCASRLLSCEHKYPIFKGVTRDICFQISLYVSRC